MRCTARLLTGQTSQTITIAVNGDSTVEPDENFTVTLSGPTPRPPSSPDRTTLPTASADCTILNDAAAPSIATLSLHDALPISSATTNFTFTVTRTGLTSVATTVNYAVMG